MKERQEDRRVRRTKKLLRQSLTELMLEKDFNDITIRDITERADLNRGTFYLHYSDPFDLLHQIEAEVLDHIQGTIDAWLSSGTQSFEYEMEPLFYPIVEYAYENRLLFQCLLENKASSDFFTQLQTLIQKNGHEIVKSRYPKADPNTCEYYFSFITYGLNGTLLHWLQQDCSLSCKDLSHMINCTITSATERLLG